MPEMRALRDGFETIREQQEMEQKGVSTYEQRKFSDFADRVNTGDAPPTGAVP